MKHKRLLVISVIGCAVFAAALFAYSFTGAPSNGKAVVRYTPPEQFYDYHKVLPVSDQALFRADGSINASVLNSLMDIINDESLDPLLRGEKQEWPTGFPYMLAPYRAITAEDFSRYVTDEPDPAYFYSQSGAIVIKLFETIPNRRGVRNAHLTELTSQWWQLVYRSADDGGDVLTLLMINPYRLTHFNGNRFDTLAEGRNDEHYIRLNPDGKIECVDIPAQAANTIQSDDGSWDFYFEGNYSQSIARSNLLRDVNGLFSRYRNAKRFIAAPSQIPAAWQSSASQTGTNARNRFYVLGESQTYRKWYPGSETPHTGLGAAGAIWGFHAHYTLINGMDGLSIGPYNGHWRHTRLEPVHDDLMWLPSDFEVRSMGHLHDNARIKTFARDPADPTSRLWTNAYYSHRDEFGYIDPDACPETRPDNARGRSGLWRLNGYDRGFTLEDMSWPDRVWLRSADSLGVGNINTVTMTGNRYAHGVIQQAGLRPGVHLDLVKLQNHDRHRTRRSPR
ncbi:MAG: hypothetical protein FWF01_01630 [Alphaproteobacteria bacterium]|nr:hypothetical protein [Alphaproteobacteria bacterium]